MALLKVCKCGKLIDYNSKYCADCTIQVEAERKNRNKDYDKYTRDKESTEFYNSNTWQLVRQDILNYYNGLCVYSLLVDNKIVMADMVHHIIPLKEDRTLSLNKSNLIPLSNSIHNVIESEYDKSNYCKLNIQRELTKLIELYKNKYKG